MANANLAQFGFSAAALENVQETGCDPHTDLNDLISGDRTAESLLDHCLDGADADRVQGWREYVDTLVAAAEPHRVQYNARNRTSRFPASWFSLGNAESDPIHTAVCHAAARSKADEELSVCEILNVEESLPNEWAADPGEQSRWYYLAEVGQEYGAVVRLDHACPERNYDASRVGANG